ncbi:hypothetical protein [Corallococcus silvisoli]|uniref:hypothetical protein n=1 Tax=Corallococcus silvisoli TaxID=2697031 RepID=UPI00191C5E4A|nr:hypothetical protein [Corallococcus silvisoli]
MANSPFVARVDGATHGATTAFLPRQRPRWSLGVIAANAVVLAYGFADALLRRVPRAREVTPRRLGPG